MANMNGSMKKVTLAGIEEGRFVQDIERVLAGVASSMIAFSNQHGYKAEKAKGEVNVKIQIICADPDNATFGFMTQITKKLPAEPANVSLALAVDEGDGKPMLFARPSGTGRDTPRQKIICTEDGKQVDPLSGEVLDGAEEKEEVTIG